MDETNIWDAPPTPFESFEDAKSDTNSTVETPKIEVNQTENDYFEI